MTATGKFVCLLTLGVGFGAINTGNNLLFLLLGMMLSLILASGVLSEGVLRGLTARRRLPQRLIAGVAAPGAFIVHNPKKYSSLSLEVSDRRAEGIAGPARGRIVGRPSIPWWKFWKKDPTEAVIGGAYSMRLEPEQTADLDARWEFAVRGRYRLENVSLVTRFPFGLFEKSRRIDDETEVTVYPAGTDASDWVSTVWSAFGEVPSNRRGLGQDFFGLREYQPGEDRRRIHWKSSARRGDLVVRENEAMQQSEVELVLCNWGDEMPAQFEAAISKTVGLIAALSERGWRVGLRFAGGHIEPAGGAAHLDRLLAELAVVERAPSPPAAGDVDEAIARIGIGSASALSRLPIPVGVTLSTDKLEARNA